ncbi:MAG: flippase-like domain-containing protein [Actinomycetota bacterium]|nr:flippase-like domain-containing protein [Actinomycetota bacterium]
MGGGQEDVEARAKRRRRLLFRVALQLLALGAVAFVFLRERHLFAGFGSTMSRITWYWLVLALVAELASIVPLAEAQRPVLSVGGVSAPRGQMILVTLASNAISMSVPGGVAVAEGYAYNRYRRFGASQAVAAWGELAAGALAFCALAGIALTGAIIDAGGIAAVLLPVLSVVFAGSAAAAAVFRHPHVLVAWVEWIEGHLGRHLGGLVARASTRVRDIARGLRGVHPTVPQWVAAFWLSALNWLLDVACLAFAFLAVGGPVPWGAVFLAFAGTKVVSSIGITPGGLGIVEGGLVATFVAYGADGATAVAAVVVYRALTLVGLVGVGWVVVGVQALRAKRRS